MTDDWLRRLDDARAGFGVRRLTYVTQLDRVGLPVAVAIRGDAFPEANSVASGAGLTNDAARFSALAEALERWSAEPRGHVEVARLRGRRECLSADELIAAHAGAEIDAWCVGKSMLDGAPIDVPAPAVFFPHAAPAPFAPNTNGLAFGTSLEGAQRSGLLECIERDAFSRAVCLRAAGQWAASTRIPRAALPRALREIAERIEAAGLELSLRDVTGEVPIATVLCTLWERLPEGRTWAHYGVACRPAAAEAALEAMLEAAQSRLVEIQGAREDMSASDRSTVDPWFLGVGASDGSLPPDAPDGLTAIVRLARSAGLGTPVWVNLTAPTQPGFVVRVVVPGAEVCAIDPDRVGPRAERWASAR